MQAATRRLVNGPQIGLDGPVLSPEEYKARHKAAEDLDRTVREHKTAADLVKA